MGVSPPPSTYLPPFSISRKKRLCENPLANWKTIKLPPDSFQFGSLGAKLHAITHLFLHPCALVCVCVCVCVCVERERDPSPGKESRQRSIYVYRVSDSLLSLRIAFVERMFGRKEHYAQAIFPSC